LVAFESAWALALQIAEPIENKMSKRNNLLMVFLI